MSNLFTSAIPRKKYIRLMPGINRATGREFYYVHMENAKDVILSLDQLDVNNPVFVIASLFEDIKKLRSTFFVVNEEPLPLIPWTLISASIDATLDSIINLPAESFNRYVKDGYAYASNTKEPTLDDLVEANLAEFAEDIYNKIIEKAKNHKGLLLGVTYRCTEAYDNERANKIKTALSKHLNPKNITINYSGHRPVVYYVY